jgi:hypothetical protein
MKYKIQFEIVSVANLTKIQQKINTWLTTGRLRKYKMHVLPTGDLLFEYCVIKDEKD